MPRLLDTRLIGLDIGDVNTKTYTGASPGFVLKVAGDGKSMELGPAPASSSAIQSLVSRDTERGREGLTFQQSLCSYWVNITPSVAPLFSSVTGVAYGRGRFVAVGWDAGFVPLIKYSSIDSTGVPTWTDVSLSGIFTTGDLIYGVKFLNDQFIAYSKNGKLATSVNGAAWTPQTLPSPGGNIYSVAYGPGVGYLAVGQTNTNNTTGNGIAWFSTDALTWTRVLPSPLGSGMVKDNSGGLTAGDIPMYGVVWGKDRFVVVGGEVYSAGYPYKDNDPSAQVKHIAWSTAGSSGWTQVLSALPTSSHYVVEYGNGRYVIGTNESLDGSITPSFTSIIYSDDASSWIKASMIPNSPPALQGNAQSVIYGNGIFVTGCANNLFASVDGMLFSRNGVSISGTWTDVGTPGAYGNGLFVMGNRSGQIVRSAFGSEIFGGGGGGGGGGSEYVWAIPWDQTLTTGSYVVNPGQVVSGSYLYRFSGDPFTPIGSGTTSTPINVGTWENVGDRAYSLVSANPTGLQLPPIYQGGLFKRIS